MSLTMGYHYGPSADLLVLACVRHEPPGPNSHPFEDYPLAGSAAILCTGGPDVIRNEAWSFYRTSSGVRLCWELEEPKGPKGPEPSKVQAYCPYADICTLGEAPSQTNLLPFHLEYPLPPS